jgi:ABC-type sugar transport system ATPase subunit
MSKIRNIKLDYNNFHLNIPELEIPNDGITAVWGKSGSGKTTLMNILVGITQAEGWSWIFDGLDLAKVPPSERHIGIVFQTYDLFPHLTAEENILIVARSRYKNSSSFEQKLIEIQTVKERLNLSNCWKTKAENLSGGEKQRVALMRAIFSDPRIIILDEPFSALDDNMRKESRSLLKSVLSELNIPVLLITHDQNDVDELCTNKIELFDGQIRRV